MTDVRRYYVMGWLGKGDFVDEIVEISEKTESRSELHKLILGILEDYELGCSSRHRGLVATNLANGLTRIYGRLRNGPQG